MHNSETWDRIALGWNHHSENGPDKHDKKIVAISEFLKDRGALTPTSDVLDLGCGPGAYAMEFAKYAKSVTCSDVSPVMIEYCKESALKAGLKNVSFKEADFITQSVDELDFRKKFDLVFTSLTPAMDGLESVEKITETTRKWAFNNSFVYFKDELKNEVMDKVFGMPPSNKWGSSSPYCLWNILWLKGYYPEMNYYREDLTKVYEVSERTALDVAENIIRDRAPSDEEVSEVLKYLKATYTDGKVLRETEALYAWTLWKI